MPAALYRATPADDWTEVEILDWRHRQYVVREVGKLWPGIMLVRFDQLRIQTDCVLTLSDARRDAQ